MKENRLKIICDFGKTLDFETTLYRQGLFKVYQGYYVKPEWLHTQRIDNGDMSLTKETSKICIYQGNYDTYYKFGCFFIMNTERFFILSKNELFSEFMTQCRKYGITKHFNTKAIETMVKSGIDKLFETKTLRKKGA